ncbi:D-lyxose ketol-isomerase [Paenibacillus sp. 1_12]|uniref:D-lyxose/D-mannose family sugar isomerase n=1 Tax=Paenibacillus sp. 1_12 TaxID=1566278 RepID=UPI0008E30457|nr:D-lyxose/D-mannose family sugar isomerase [Paenibacillus sp. 1_12]SFM37338.1 D-lyxose ketol-isomerase [Paenibacillus sp. 1_12]
MITNEEWSAARDKTIEMFVEAGIALSEREQASIEVADFGLGHLITEGLELITYINNDRYCAKELVLFPRQTCPEHLHPPIGADPGKMETFRCRSGVVYLYVDGPPAADIQAIVPASSEAYYTVFHEIVLHPGEQYTISPGTRHWFQAGSEGAIVSEFSSTSRDEYDLFTDPRIKRLPEIAEG